MKNYTDLNIILDRSGSMSVIANDMVGGIKTFLEKEKQTGDETKVSLYQFDDRYENVFFDRDIKEDIDALDGIAADTERSDAIRASVLDGAEHGLI